MGQAGNLSCKFDDGTTTGAQVGEMWQDSSEEDKAPFKAMAQADKDRYLGELEAHNYRWGNRST